ncbi:MAG: DUF4920 domain-containing protein [Crocinitomicaceae bacterium]|nr:DUF4920 domain-containing protein [Crocinitomicaceae bacterium]|tara:strand:+ start:3203 stop:3814 length:612 start_codon:yes stop_codon:yes gene_type:complete
MKYLLIPFIVFSLIFASCGSESNTEPVAATEVEQASENTETEESRESGIVSPSMFGAEITVEEVTSKDEFFEQLKTTDTLRDIVISGKIASVCQKKGCWMKVDLGDESLVFVKFLDYEFFMPKDSDGSLAIMQGNAYAETVSIEERKHYAEDAGKSEEEIAAITEPKTTYSFMASGVILKDYVRKERTTPSEEESTEEADTEG